MQQRALIAVLAVLGAVAVGSALSGIILGPASAPGGSATSPSVDSEYRFVNVFWLAAGIAVWWSLLRVHERTTVLRTMLVLAFVGGFARAVSVVVTGWPHPVYIASMVLELAIVPLVLWWHIRVVDVGRPAGPSAGRDAPSPSDGPSPTADV